jgi:hypothetical protein
MAKWRQAVELAMTDEEAELKEWIMAGIDDVNRRPVIHLVLSARRACLI